MTVSLDILRSCPQHKRRTLVSCLVQGLTRAFDSSGAVAIRGPVLSTHHHTNQPGYRRDAYLEETVQGILRQPEFLFYYGA